MTCGIEFWFMLGIALAIGLAIGIWLARAFMGEPVEEDYIYENPTTKKEDNSR